MIKGLVFQKEMNFCSMCSFGNPFKRSLIVSLDVKDCCLVSLWWVVLWHSELNTQHKKYVLITVSCSELLVSLIHLLLQVHLSENKLAKKTNPPFTKLAKKLDKCQSFMRLKIDSRNISVRERILGNPYIRARIKIIWLNICGINFGVIRDVET